ncbi:hypothetical protein [Rothia kristinae]|uniref:Uncharacterized protein n=1 Tax=Rothia kristinae TaxID=37923 RepID=A0A199NTF1_9MICC|nr:hypothetical protein [Rothia kristinae]OAX52369.1 hypothetical protein AN277_0203095 [Rothia kristinae]
MTSSRRTADSPATLLIIADPGLPTRRLRRIQDDLVRRLETTTPGGARLLTRTGTVRVRPDDTIDLGVAADLAPDDRTVDATILLTEMPRHAGGHPLVAETFADQRVAVVSCPTLGVPFPRRRLVRTILACAARLLDAKEDRGSQHWNRWKRHPATGHLSLFAHTITGVPRTVLGMVAANDPWRTAPKLSSAMAAAAGVGAFGVFYSSIWQMSDALSTARLLSIGVLAVVLMTGWLLVSNRLWDRPAKERLGAVVGLYNASTVLTLLLCVLVLYAALVVLILLAGLVVIDPEFMASTLGTGEVGFTNYLDIAWMSAAMGVVAGALGSSFDSQTDLRRLTHGQRERQRRLTEESGEGSQDAAPGTHRG